MTATTTRERTGLYICNLCKTAVNVEMPTDPNALRVYPLPKGWLLVPIRDLAKDDVLLCESCVEDARRALLRAVGGNHGEPRGFMTVGDLLELLGRAPPELPACVVVGSVEHEIDDEQTGFLRGTDDDRFLIEPGNPVRKKEPAR